MKYVLGIDGGGTKTTGVIANSEGRVFGEVTVGASNPNSVPKEQLRNEFSQLFSQLKESNNKVFDQVEHVFAGLSGADHMDTRRDMTDLLQTLLPDQTKVTVDNDAITALYSGTLGKPGIVQIAGTGAISFGVNAHGERKRVGGWGYLLGDHGSGYSIGRDALHEVFLVHDGRRAETLLSEKIVNHFKVEHVPDLIRYIYQETGAREQIASLSRIVMEAADENDQAAIGIIDRNGLELGKSISHLLVQLFDESYNEDTRKQIPVILVGGLFNRIDLLKKSIEIGLGENNERTNLIIPEILPVGGAVIAALREENVFIDESFVKRFNPLE